MIARSLVLIATLAVSSIACGPSAPPTSLAPMSPIEGSVDSADGVSIHYVTEGSGPAVVLVHCLGCNLHYWDVAAADLARDHRVIRLDLAGHGSSGANRTTWSVEAFAADIHAVVNATGVYNFTLVGHSMSGPIALETAKELRERVTGIVPVDTLLDVEEHIPAEKRTEMLTLVRTHYKDFTEQLLPTLMPPNPDAKVVARVQADALAMDPSRAASILESVFTYPSDVTMDHLAMPIVAIDSDRRPVEIDHNRAHAPQFEARVMENTGHWLMLDRPAEFAKTLRDVVVEIESGRANRRP